MCHMATLGTHDTGWQTQRFTRFTLVIRFIRDLVVYDSQNMDFKNGLFKVIHEVPKLYHKLQYLFHQYNYNYLEFMVKKHETIDT